MEIPLLFFGSVFVLLEELILFAEFEDEGIEFLIINFDSFEFEDLGLESVDDVVFLIALGLGDVMGTCGSFGVVEVFAVHPRIILKFIIFLSAQPTFKYHIVSTFNGSIFTTHHIFMNQTNLGECQPEQQVGSFMKSSQSMVSLPQQLQYFLRSWKTGAPLW